MEERNYTYSEPQNFDRGESTPQYKVHEKKSRVPGWIKAIIIILVIGLVLVLLCRSCTNSFTSSFMGQTTQSDIVELNYNYDYIASIYIQGSIDEEGTGSYYHSYILNTISALEEDNHNKGIILWVDTPGGTVMASDELYLKLCEYQDKTNRPIYASFQSQATSGGYYISARADKIIANRNCWTGSIGVTMGSYFDITELLEKYGVKVNTITSGANKAMGSSFIEMTDEQKEIFQSLVDDAYEQFVGIVADGRNMDIDTVKKLADGRVYTANQALENGLIDSLGTYEDVIDMMRKDLNNEELEVIEFITYDTTESIYSLLGNALKKNDAASELDEIKELVALMNKFEISYMSSIVK